MLVSLPEFSAADASVHECCRFDAILKLKQNWPLNLGILQLLTAEKLQKKITSDKWKFLSKVYGHIFSFDSMYRPVIEQDNPSFRA